MDKGDHVTKKILTRFDTIAKYIFKHDNKNLTAAHGPMEANFYDQNEKFNILRPSRSSAYGLAGWH